MKFIPILFAALFLGACSYVQPVGDKAAELLGKGVNKYCTELDAQARQRVKDATVAAVAPHSLSVTCAGE